MNMQLESLVQNSGGPNYHYMGLYLNDDAVMMGKASSRVAGLLLSGWWDKSSEAGPTRRPQSNFSEDLPTLEVLSVASGVRKTL